MKTILIVLITWSSYFCIFGNGLTHQKFDLDSTSNITERIIGKWTVTATTTWYIMPDTVRGSTLVGNTCPKIEFNKDQTALVLLPSGQTEKLSWKLINDHLVLTNKSKPDCDSFFADSQYEMQFSSKKEITELKLTYFKDKYAVTFTLRK